MRNRRPSTLIINRSDSYCNNCGKPANPNQKSHEVLLGWGPDNGQPGCGIVWDSVDTDYFGMPLAMRPDLPRVGFTVDA